VRRRIHVRRRMHMYNTEADLFLEARKLPVRRRIHVRRRMHMYNTEADLFLEAR
jgi:hypothetical protein